MKSDIDRWNVKYESHQYTTEIRPDPVLTDNIHLLTGKGCALDLASGSCDNALCLAARGYATVAIDGSHTALKLGKQKAADHGLDLSCFVADLDSYPIPRNLFDIVIVVRYLNRDIIESIQHALKPGGLLFFKTFNRRFLDQNPSFPVEYVLEDGELSEWFRSWACIATNENQPGDGPLSYWVGRKT